MNYPFRTVDGVIVQQVKSRDSIPGWTDWPDRVAIGSTFDGSTVTPPPPPPPPTPAEIEAEVQGLADDIAAGSDRDKALAMVIADVVAKAFNITTPEARQMVRDRLVVHLRTLKGL